MRTKILVREVMNSPVVSARMHDSAKQLAEKMANLKVGSVVIMNREDPVGIVTDGDIVLKVVARDLKPSEVKAKSIMSSPVSTIDASKDMTEAARMMRRFKVKRLGVTYRGKIVGIVSMSDLTAVTPDLLDIVSEKARIMTGESRRHSGYLAGYCDGCSQWTDYLMESDGRFLCEECRAESSREE